MSLPFQLVRTVTGVPTVANFANMDGVPIVINDATGTAYTLVAGVVTAIGSNAFAPAITTLSNSLAGDVALNNTAAYFTGPTVAQGTAGTWFVSGTVTVRDTVQAVFLAKLWDGTTVIASTVTQNPVATNDISISLSGVIASPAGNLRISVRDASSTNGTMRFNSSGESKDSTITAVRIA